MLKHPICILVVDDEEKLVRAIGDLLKSHNYEILSAYDGEEALDVFYENNTKIDLILLDAMMPKIDGFEVIEEIRGEGSLIPIIMLTARGEEYDQVKGLETGADDYIVKPFAPTVLLARIEAILRRVKPDVEKLEMNGIKMLSKSREAIVGEEKIKLTRKEYDLLYFLMLNKNMVFSRAHLVNQLWGYDFEGDDRTVDTHVKQLRAKLGEKGDLITTIHKVGYIIKD